MGGLGNQMFQYAFGLGVSRLHGRQLFFDHSRDLGRSGYALDRYALEVRFASPSGFTYREQGLSFNPAALTAPDGGFIGYWQTEKYFLNVANDLRTAFLNPHNLSFATRGTAQMIYGSNAVFIHIRRGDNLSARALSFHGNLWDTDYYVRAIAHVRSRVPDPTFFIFSDDPDWCCGTPWPENSVVVNSNNPDTEAHQDLWLMSQCRHGIIANSSFSWWGAWLQHALESQVVIAPKRWFVAEGVRNEDIIPERWVQL